MLAQWQRPFILNTLYDDWDNAPAYSGVYVISGDREIPRIAGTDKAGILYIGKSAMLRNRLWEFWYGDHEAPAFLWTDLRLAGLVLGVRRLTRGQLENKLGELKARVSQVETRSLASAEKAVLYAYASRFGELPPLNATLPDKWSERPDPRLLRWAETGLRKS
jgi:hypothetical protein